MLSWNPRILLYDDFLKEEEVQAWNELSTKATEHDWQRTGLVGINGELVPGNTVTSNIWFMPEGDEMVKDLQRRIAEITMFPEETMEPLKMLRYTNGSYFRGHIDAHALTGHPTTTRVATAFVYLSGDITPDAGATFFPLAIATPAARGIEGVSVGEVPPACNSFQGKDPRVQAKDVMATYLDGYDVLDRSPGEEKKHVSDKRRKGGEAEVADVVEGLAVLPKPGRLLVWWSRRPDGQLEPRSQHAGCPLAAGRARKFALTQWIHMVPVEAAGPQFSERAKGIHRTLDWPACPGWKHSWMKQLAPTVDARRCSLHMQETQEAHKEDAGNVMRSFRLPQSPWYGRRAPNYGGFSYR